MEPREDSADVVAGVGIGGESETVDTGANQLTGEMGNCGDPRDVVTSLAPLLVEVAASDRAAGLRPPRFDLTYSHGMARATHFEHEGFSLWHLTLDAAHATQLSRSLGMAGAEDGRGRG